LQVPMLQPSFLTSMPSDTSLDSLPTNWRRSAVYELLSNGRVPSDHPEHPDAVTGAQVHNTC